MTLAYFETEIDSKNFYFFYMGSGVQEVLMVEDSLDLGHPRKLIKTPLSFSTQEDFHEYHKEYFNDEECIKSFVNEYMK